MALESGIRNFINEELGIDISSISNSGALFTSGVIDSFAFVEVLSFVEGEIGRQIDIAELSLEDIDSIEALSKLGS